MKKLDFKTKISYGVGNLGYGSMGQTVSSFIMFYGTSVLGLSGLLVGITIAITSLWDGLSDPLVGYLSDHTSSKRFGRRLGHMLFATFALAGCNILLWLCPATTQAGKMLWILVLLLLQETFNTFFATPYSALCIDIAPDYNDQSKMQGFKTVFYILGMIMPSLLMSLFMPATENGQFSRSGYINIALVNSALVILCGLVTVFGTMRRVRCMPNYDKAMTGDEELKEQNFVEIQGEKFLNSGNLQKTQKKRKKTSKNRQKNRIFGFYYFFRKKKSQPKAEMELKEKTKSCGEVFQKTEGADIGETQQKRAKASEERMECKGNFERNSGRKSEINFGIKSEINSEKKSEKKFKKAKGNKKFALKTLIAGYSEVLGKRDFRCVMLGYSVSLIASVFITSVGMHLFTFCYNFSSAQISAIMICFFGGAIASQFLWVNVVKKYDKKQTLIFALCVMLFGVAATSITFLFRLYVSTNTIFFWVLPCLFLCGVGSGALYSLPHSMYADVVTMDTYLTGKNNAGRYTGYYTFTYNFSNSISLFFIGLLLDLVNFDSSAPTQSLSVQTGLGKIVFFGAAIALTVAIVIFSKYSLRRSDVLKVQIKANKKSEKQER